MFKTNMDNFMWNVDIKLNEYDSEKDNNLIK